MVTVAALLRERADDDRVGLKFEDATWTWREHVQRSADLAAWLAGRLDAGQPPHVGILLDNVPEFSFLLGATALSGAVAVGLNTTRSAVELARDAAHTVCQLVVTDPSHAHLAERIDAPVVLVDDIDAPDGSPLPRTEVTDDDLFVLIFTSGTTSAPKAVRCSHGKIANSASFIADGFGLGPGETCYSAMPLFHSNAIIAGWTPALVGGAAIALRRRFSASGFLADVRRFGATYANYVGKPLSFVLATPEGPDDADNPLRIVFGNEATDRDIREFARRFGCQVVDAYGSTEGGIAIMRTDGTPPGSLGIGVGDVAVVGPDGNELAAGEVGELVNRDGPGSFEGYWANPEADEQRVRDGWYWSGDLAWRDEQGFLYFAGRTGGWLRVDGENLAVAPIERVLGEHPDVVLVAVYAVPDRTGVGDEIAAALMLRDGAELDLDEFGAWLDARDDLSRKQRPRWVRVVDELPMTPTNKIVHRELAAQGTVEAVELPR